tara:strand:+ start:249 stop:1550 length:1302 start_codon:yes stop_codon:yes gene_type:complete
MVHWNSSPHPISDIRDWSEAGRLEVRPDFQRREVWSAPAKIMLMDTILRDVPMPKIFLANTIRDGKTYRVVIDGQQRITAILDFLRDKFTLDSPYSGAEKGRKFSELDPDLQDQFLSYSIDFNEANKPTEEEVREVYARVNKYTVPLTKQELRRADFPGDFLQISEELSVDEFFDEVGIFSAANRRRYADVEYVSELLAAMIGGIQDKKSTLDDFYVEYSTWGEEHKSEIISRVNKIFRELSFIFDESFKISKTRFKQKSDFYTLFLAIDDFVQEGCSVLEQDLTFLREDLKMLEETIRPESEIEICSEYAIKCVSQANSASSRRWRHQFLKAIISGTYTGHVPDKTGSKVIYRLFEEVSQDNSGGMCPPPKFDCPICGHEIYHDFKECQIGWHRTGPVKQIANAIWIHTSCAKDQAEWLVMERPNDDQQDLL